MPAFALPGPLSVQGAGITSTDEGWFIAAPVQDHDLDPSRIVEFRGEHEVWGRLPSPERDAESPTMENSRPFVRSGGGLALLWTEARNPGWQMSGSQTWPHYYPTEIWMSEWSGSWSTPHNLLGGSYFLLMHGGFEVQETPGSGAALLSVVRYSDHERVLFGFPPDSLRVIPLDASVSPNLGSFYIDDGGTVHVAIQATARRVREHPALAYRMLLTSSSDRGRSWSAPEEVFRFAESASGLRLRRDAEGGEHLLWRDSSMGIVHRKRGSASAQWQSDEGGIRDGGPIVDWVAGVDQCGRLTVVGVVIERDQFMIRRWSWVEGRWMREDSHGRHAGIGLFDGTDREGRWVVGWSGVNLDGPSVENWVWILNP